MKQHSAKGFTLIELMIVVAVVAILAAIAYPSYTDSVRKSRRAEAKTALESARLAQAKWRANNTTYGTTAEIGLQHTDHYNLAVTANNQTGFTATATATAVDNQNSDTEACLVFTINQDGPVGDAAHIDACWK